MADAVNSALTSARSFLDDLITAVSEADYAYEEKEDNEAFLRLGKKLAGWQYDGTFASHRDDLDAALRARLSQAGAGGVVVKPLVWNEYETEGEIDRWDAETALGSFYEISTEFDGYSVSNDHVHTALRFGSPDEAKAFAQNDYEARILAALAPSPSAGEPVAWRWRHCGEQGWRLSWDKPFNPGIELKPLYEDTTAVLVELANERATPPATPVQPTESVEAVRALGEAIINASNVADETCAIDGRTLVLSAPDGVLKIDLRKLASLTPAPTGEEDGGETEQTFDEGIDFALVQLTAFLGVDQSTVTWDAATETLDGDVRSVIGNILRAKFGEDWSPATPTSSPASGDTVADLRRDLWEAKYALSQAREHAQTWHRICQAIATVLDLPEPEADFANVVRDWSERAKPTTSPAGGVREALEALDTVEFMDPPDGGDVSLAEQVRRMSQAYKRRGDDIVALMAAIDAEKAERRKERAARMSFLGAARKALNTSGLTSEQIIIADNAISEAFRRVREEARHDD